MLYGAVPSRFVKAIALTKRDKGDFEGRRAV
jgi:hypothetical protein